jgi:hypothetical protein
MRKKLHRHFRRHVAVYSDVCKKFLTAQSHIFSLKSLLCIIVDCFYSGKYLKNPFSLVFLLQALSFTTMRKQTLQFCSLLELAAFARQMNAGYVINTQSLTLTGMFSEADIQMAIINYNARSSEKIEALLDTCL